MIDALFGSKTRVKLLGLFMNNPHRSFYVREITRNINEQINSVRRELANLVRIGIITDRSVDNRLYYQADTKFRYFASLKDMFANDQAVVSEVVFSGVMVYESDSKIDLVVAGNQLDETKVKSLIKVLERETGSSLNYTIMSLDDLDYRLSIRDKFVLNVLESKHITVLDDAGILVDYPGVNDQAEARRSKHGD